MDVTVRSAVLSAAPNGNISLPVAVIGFVVLFGIAMAWKISNRKRDGA